MADRSVRAGSLWRTKNIPEPWEVRVVVARKDTGGRTGLPTRWVAFVVVDDPKTGGVMHEVDFRQDYEWVAGR